MAMKLKMVKPKSGGGFTEKFRLTELKHIIRVFPFVHNGEANLAALDFVHFGGTGEAPVPCLGQGCPACLAANKAGNKRGKKVTRYPMLIVDVDGDKTKLVRFDAPQSVYKAIYGLISEGDADDYLGNNGMDFLIKTNPKSEPSNRYTVMPRVKGSEVLEIPDSEIDLIAEVEADRESNGIGTTDATDDTPADDADGDAGGDTPDVEDAADDADAPADDDATDDADDKEEAKPAAKTVASVKCVACNGKGKNSKGGVCDSCRGKGKIATTPAAKPAAKPAPKAPAKKEEDEAVDDPWADTDDDAEDAAAEEPAADEPAAEDDDDGADDIKAKDKVLFSQGGKKIKGVFTGKFRQGKMVIEANGQLWTIDSDKVSKA